MNVSTLLATVRPSVDDDRSVATDVAAALCAEAPRLRRLAHRLLGWRAQADELDDLVQDVLLKAWRHHRSFRGDASLATWLCRITMRVASDHVRRQVLRRRLFGWFLPNMAEPVSSAPATGDEPRDRTHFAIQQLAHRDREVLVLRYLEQRDIVDIAALLGISRAAVDARLSRARDRLRQQLRSEEAS